MNDGNEIRSQLLEELGDEAPVIDSHSSQISMRARLARKYDVQPKHLWSAFTVVALILAATAFLILRPIPVPDYSNDSIDKVMGFTLLTDEFNDLPVQRRLDLLAELIERLKNMDATDSVLLAQLAASIKDKAREQLMENVSRLMVDKWDTYAVDYSRVPTEERGEYMDGMVVDLVRTMEALTGEDSGMTDDDIMRESKTQAQRDRDMLSEGRGPNASQLGRLAAFLQSEGRKVQTPQQRIRDNQFSRDFVRHLREEPLEGPVER